MTYAVVFIAGLAAYKLWVSVALRIFRRLFASDREDRIRKDLFQGMKYDSLLRVRGALESEIAKRQP